MRRTSRAISGGLSPEVQSLERWFLHVDAVIPIPSPTPTATPIAVRLGQPFAIVRIPRFGADFARPVIEDTEHEMLGKGVGHYVGTAKPGMGGACEPKFSARLRYVLFSKLVEIIPRAEGLQASLMVVPRGVS